MLKTVLLTILLMVTACSEQDPQLQNAYVEQYMRHIRNDIQPGEITPMPVMKPYEVKRPEIARNPFYSLTTLMLPSVKSPDTNTSVLPANDSITAYKLLFTNIKSSPKTALLRSPDGSAYRKKLGSVFAMEQAKIIDITQNSVVVKVKNKTITLRRQ